MKRLVFDDVFIDKQYHTISYKPFEDGLYCSVCVTCSRWTGGLVQNLSQTGITLRRSWILIFIRRFISLQPLMRHHSSVYVIGNRTVLQKTFREPLNATHRHYSRLLRQLSCVDGIICLCEVLNLMNVSEL